MEKYTTHIYRQCEARLHNTQLSQADLISLVPFGQQHTRLFRIAAKILADGMRDGEIPHIDTLQSYLKNNSVLITAVDAEQKKYEHGIARAASIAHSQERDGFYKEKQAKRQESQKKEQAKRTAEELAFWQQKKEQDRENEKCCQEVQRAPFG